MGAVDSPHGMSSRPRLEHPWCKAAASPASPHLPLYDSCETKFKMLGTTQRKPSALGCKFQT